MALFQHSNLERPIFFIGAPRSGTTVTYEAFAQHRALGWLSNYSAMAPTFPALNLARQLFENRFFRVVGHKKQYGKTLPGNRFLPQTSECYDFWDHYSGINFSRDYLVDRVASTDEANRVRRALSAVVRHQGKDRLTVKMTGPSRIGYLLSVFPDAQFVHVVRDGRAVVQSLLKVDFWREKGGYDAPFWEGGLTAEDLAYWQEDPHPAVLTAVQWKRIVELTELEAKQLDDDAWMTVQYEQFVQDPHATTRKFFAFSGLEDDDRAHEFLSAGARLVNMNFKAESGGDPAIERAHRYIRPWLDHYGYT